jgi:hypothetical protein
MRQAGHVAHMEEVRNAYRIFIGTPTTKITLGRFNVDGRIH